MTGRGWCVPCVAGVSAASDVVEVVAAVCVGGRGGVDGGVVCVAESFRFCVHWSLLLLVGCNCEAW